MQCLYTISTPPTQYSFYDRVSIVSVGMMVATSVASVDTSILLLLALTVPTKVTLVAYDNNVSILLTLIVAATVMLESELVVEAQVPPGSLPHYLRRQTCHCCSVAERFCTTQLLSLLE